MCGQHVFKLIIVYLHVTDDIPLNLCTTVLRHVAFIHKMLYTKDDIKLIGGIFITAEAAWDYAIGMIRIDGLEPTEDFKKYIEPEKDILLQGRVF